jgi:NAD dependent epimerase/dehydratase family enzyme
MEALRNAMHMPLAIALPDVLLRIGAIFIRTEPELILKSRKVYPKRLLDEGFVFEFSDVRNAFEDLCQTKKTIT